MPFFLPFLGGLLGKVATGVAVAGASALASKALAPKQETTTKTSVDLDQLKADAKRTGVNYITAIRHIGMGYTNSTTTHPKENIGGQIFGNAIGSIVQGVMNFDPYASRQSELNTMLMERDLFSSNNKTGSMTGKGNFANSIGNLINGFETRLASLTNPHLDHKIDTRYADAEAFETRYGDIAQEFAGARNAIFDVWANYGDTLLGHVPNTDGLTVDQAITNLRHKVYEDLPFLAGVNTSSKTHRYATKPKITLDSFKRSGGNFYR
jgi:hypothetical protein